MGQLVWRAVWPLHHGLSEPQFTKITNRFFFQIPLSVLVLNTTCEMEQETMSPLGSPSHLQKFPHAAWRANG